MRLALPCFVIIRIYVWKLADGKPNNICYDAKTCIHDGKEKCGVDGTNYRLFLDSCDIKEYNCLNDANYRKTGDRKQCPEQLPSSPSDASTATVANPLSHHKKHSHKRKYKHIESDSESEYEYDNDSQESTTNDPLTHKHKHKPKRKPKHTTKAHHSKKHKKHHTKLPINTTSPRSIITSELDPSSGPSYDICLSTCATPYSSICKC